MSERRRDELAALFRDIFEDDRRGAAILEHLTNRFGRAEVVTTGGVDAVLQTYRAGGQREVIDYILNMVNHANGVTEPDEVDGAPQAD